MKQWKVISISHNDATHSPRQMQWQSALYSNLVNAQKIFIKKVAQYIESKTRVFMGLSPDGKMATFKEDDIIWEIRIITEYE